MSEFRLPLVPRDQNWLDLRERLVRAARELHFSGIANENGNGPAILVVAGNLAGLALSIPMPPRQRMPGGVVDASTLLATQILQLDGQTDGNATGGTDNSAPNFKED